MESLGKFAAHQSSHSPWATRALAARRSRPSWILACSPRATKPAFSLMRTMSWPRVGTGRFAGGTIAAAFMRALLREIRSNDQGLIGGRRYVGQDVCAVAQSRRHAIE